MYSETKTCFMKITQKKQLQNEVNILAGENLKGANRTEITFTVFLEKRKKSD